MTIIDKFVESLVEPILFKRMERYVKLYEDEDFDQILNNFKAPYDSKYLSRIYENIFRYLSLMRSGDSKWKGEYKASHDSGELKLLGEADEAYIDFYIYCFIKLPNEKLQTWSFDLNLVSARTKAYFPFINGIHFNKNDNSLLYFDYQN